MQSGVYGRQSGLIVAKESALAAKTYIALWRGLNVGGHGKAPMAQLRAMLEEMGFSQVKTYVQSGNAVFRSEGKADAAAIAKAFSKAFGFSARVFLFEGEAWAKLVAANPYAKATSDPKTLHLFVMEGKPAAAQMNALDEKLAGLTGKQAEDEYALKGGALYLHVPNGLGRSKLAAMLERTLKVEMTGRNWRTVLTLQEMAEAAGKD